MSDFEFVKSDEIFDRCEYKQNISIRFYQIAQYPINNLYDIRSYLFEGSNGNSCLYEFKIKERNDYKLSKKDLHKFVKTLRNIKNTNVLKTKYKIYPYSDFNSVAPPDGNYLQMIVSDLIK
jgi:hypothetical protein